MGELNFRIGLSAEEARQECYWCYHWHQERRVPATSAYRTAGNSFWIFTCDDHLRECGPQEARDFLASQHDGPSAPAHAGGADASCPCYGQGFIDGRQAQHDGE
jgi:hypothetical protein